MFRQLNLRSFFTFLGRNKLYTAINIFGLSVSLMFVILIADFTVRQLTVDKFHAKADRIHVIGSENGSTSAYYLQKYLTDRYPEIEAACAVSVSGWSTHDTEQVRIGEKKYAASALYADTTFFRIFDFPLLAGDREQALAARNSAVLSESFARKAFGAANPLGQVVRIDNDDDEVPDEFVVTAVMRDLDRSTIPNRDILLRAERITQLNPSNSPQMNNAGAVLTFLLVREGADLEAKTPDMVEYFKEFYWPYKGNALKGVVLTPLKQYWFSEVAAKTPITDHGSRSFVAILIAVGLVILVFAVINYINLTVAQTGFRAREMAMRRLLGSTRGEVIAKLIIESILLCAAAFVVAMVLAVTVEPYAAQLLESRIDLIGGLRGGTVAAYAGLIVVLGVLAGVVPALIISRFKPLDMVGGTFRRKTKMLYSNVLITLQNVVTVVLLVASLTILLQIRHLINTPLGYNTTDMLDIPTEIFPNYFRIRQFCDELSSEPCVEAVGMGCGTPLDGGNNNTMSWGPDRMVSFQTFIGDSTYFRMLGLEVLRDNHMPGAYMLNEYALRELGVTADTTHMKLGPDYSWNMEIGGVVRDFQIRSAIDRPSSAMLLNIGNFDSFVEEGRFNGTYPWNVLVQTRGDKAAAFERVRSVYDRICDDGFFTGEYMEESLRQAYAEQQRLLRIVGVFTFVAILISALGLLAMSTYYIQQKQQAVAVRKVFGSTRGEVLARLVGHFMRMTGIAFLVAVPVAWYAMTRWLEEYSVRIALSPLIFLAAGAFAAVVAFIVVFWQSRRAADANPIDSIKN